MTQEDRTIRIAHAAGRRRGRVFKASSSLDFRGSSVSDRPSLAVLPVALSQSGEKSAPLPEGSATIRAQAIPDRRRGRSMSRRSGQHGYIEVKGRWYVVRFWQDEGAKRVHKSVKICPVNGPGSLTKPERKRRAKEIIIASGADSPECLARAEAVMSGLGFREQAEKWIEHIKVRKRRPVKMATVHGYRHLLDRWILPSLGDLPLCDINNSTVKLLVLKMVESHMAPESIRHVVKVVRLVVASYVSEDGEPVFRRSWNPEFMDMPVVEKKNQRRPTFIGEEVTRVVSLAEGMYRVLFALLAGTGMRIAEALGLEIGTHISSDGSTITVGQSVWRHGEVQTPKTENAYREIDLHPSLAGMLRAYIGKRQSGFLFATRNGRPLSQRNALRALHSVLGHLRVEKRGFHAFRRLRQTWLRKSQAPEDLIRFWLGWANKSIADSYSKLQDDVLFRKSVAESMGLGFEVPPQKSGDVPNCTLREVVSEVV